jgi:hypothetical protein
MKKLLAVVMLCGAEMTIFATGACSQQMVSSGSPVSSTPVVSSTPAADADNHSASLSLPPLPKGKTTILGGEIRNFDPVRDQFLLRLYGQRPMKIWFDERTQVYRNGEKIPVRELGPEDHASIETILDGDNVFAVSIHILSASPEGECEGRVVRYNPDAGELVVASQMSPAPVTFLVPANTSIARVGEGEFTTRPSGLSDLMTGSLVSVSFTAAPARRNVAKEIKVMAVPGAAFEFSGNISFLDMHTGTMVIVDPRDEKSYQIHFDSARLPASATLRPQKNVTVTATYDGTGYAASAITTN